jgi:hypothetical protein
VPEDLPHLLDGGHWIVEGERVDVLAERHAVYDGVPKDESRWPCRERGIRPVRPEVRQLPFEVEGEIAAEDGRAVPRGRWRPALHEQPIEREREVHARSQREGNEPQNRGFTSMKEKRPVGASSLNSTMATPVYFSGRSRASEASRRSDETGTLLRVSSLSAHEGFVHTGVLEDEQRLTVPEK